MTTQPSKLSHSSAFAVLASQYSYDQLADIYNHARIDYIVPMPMNGKRMAEYVRDYDVNLDASAVALNGDNLELGVCMLGIRGERAWITRLGVIPERRGRHIGQFLTELMLANARTLGAQRVQLEVIRGNEPATRLFHKLGFEPVRDLMVVRRPPGAPHESLCVPNAEIEPLDNARIVALLREYEQTQCAAWTEEAASLRNSGNLRGLHVTLSSSESGWLIFQRLPFQLTHFVFGGVTSEPVIQALLYHLHKTYSAQDTKVENLPIDHPAWQVMERFGYLEAFQRIEMYLYL
ncbi:MAG: GNAT family N-acetyltransferase [Anaerolineae bacterium]|nr:GNAT family N-acetyltransferase [Anaerolineae bacterium]MDW8299379.1 GNAT family N-acetyltransferase [Anaerolineae bacterium]